MSVSNPTNSTPIDYNLLKEHPDFQQWQVENTRWNPYEGSQGTTSAPSTNPATYNGLYPYNGNYRYVVGYTPGDRYNTLFSDKSIRFISDMVTKGLVGVHPEGKNIIVPDNTIRSVCDTIFEGTTANPDVMQKMVISFIINSITTEYETMIKNNKLSIWVTNYTPDTGMQKFDGIKLNKKQRSHSGYWKY